MDALVDLASTWLTDEKQRPERERAVGQAWLSLLVEGDPGRVGRALLEVAERTQSADLDVLPKLQKCARAYIEEMTRIAMLRTMRGRNLGREEEALRT